MACDAKKDLIPRNLLACALQLRIFGGGELDEGFYAKKISRSV